jgi:mannose-6-phosphate isomerase-like protein (cupin superfamily)
MTEQFIFRGADAKTVKRPGYSITFFRDDDLSPNIVYIDVEKDHLTEWYSDTATQSWYVIEGKGTFVLDDKKYEVGAGDLIVVPPKVKKYYFGKMKMILITTPKFNPDDEHKVL